MQCVIKSLPLEDITGSHNFWCKIYQTFKKYIISVYKLETKKKRANAIQRIHCSSYHNTKSDKENLREKNSRLILLMQKSLKE